MTATLDPALAIRTIEEFKFACLEKIIESPSTGDVQDEVLDLYLETVRRIENGWMISSVLTNACIRLTHL
jgi:hypothetical protein